MAQAGTGGVAAQRKRQADPLVETSAPAVPAKPAGKPRRKSRGDNAGAMIEIEIGGMVIRVGRGADAEMVAAVIAALKAAT